MRPGSCLRELLLLGLVADVAGNWPICYDYRVKDASFCPERDNKGNIREGTTKSYFFCYHTNMWDVTSPPPTCRDSGCQSDTTSSCCCGADPSVPGTVDPNEDSNPASICGDSKWGVYQETGAAAGGCTSCQEGDGAANGVGGRVRETYGDKTLAEGILDVQTFGHISSLDYKLPSCSTGMKTLFSSKEAVVNEMCNVKSFLELRSCGNCYRAICEFHNELHFHNGKEYECLEDLFMRRLECYANWYFKFCDCDVKVPDCVFDEEQNEVCNDLHAYKATCVRTPFFQWNPDKGRFPICASAARPRADLFLLISVLLVGLVYSRS